MDASLTVDFQYSAMVVCRAEMLVGELKVELPVQASWQNPRRSQRGCKLGTVSCDQEALKAPRSPGLQLALLMSLNDKPVTSRNCCSVLSFLDSYEWK